MREGARQARQVVAVKSHDGRFAAPFQLADQDLQHRVGAFQPVEIAQQAGSVGNIARIEQGGDVRVDRRPL